jgi:hypothetical protein
MSERQPSLLFVASLVVGVVACGGSSGTSTTVGTTGTFGNQGTFGGTPASGSSLTNTCTNICNNVFSTCAVPQNVYTQCLNACQSLTFVESSCITDFAAYLACLAGANAVSCVGNQYILSPPACASQQQAYASCTGPKFAACIELSNDSTTCTQGNNRRTFFCLDAPDGCDSAGGLLGPYCCP